MKLLRTDVLLAVALPVLLLAGLLATYSPELNKRSSISEYFNAVYRSRFLGRELVLGIANGAGKVLVALGEGRPHGLMIGWMLTNGLGFIGSALLLYASTGLINRHLNRTYVAGVIVMAVSSITVTPYDLISYAVIIGVFMALRSGRTSWSIVLMVVAMAIRESAFLVIPIAVAALMPAPVDRGVTTLSTWRRAARTFVGWRAIWSSLLVGVLTYAVLKIQANRSGHELTLVQHISAARHLSTRSAAGLGLAVVMALAVRWSYRHLADRREIATRCNVMWVLSLPYLVVCAIWGIWSEAPRLIMPLLLGECLLAGWVCARVSSSAVESDSCGFNVPIHEPS